MAKQRSYKNIHDAALELAHLMRIERYAKAVDQIYAEAVKEFAALAKTVRFDPKKPFTFKDYPGAHQKAKRLFASMANAVTAQIRSGNAIEWGHANKNNDDLVKAAFPSANIDDRQFTRFFNRNQDALEAFQFRKDGGFTLSDRVWRQTEQFRNEIEMGIDVGLSDGRSASALSRDLRSYLNEPDKLFRRVRDKRGQMHLSKAAASFHPGQGVYRSSYKNAMRLTRTEINMAYRQSDHTRWQQLDFIVGYEIKLSNNPNHCPMCAALQGRYPKDFKFTGWHPQCRCRMIPIFKTDEEMDADTMRILNGEPVGLPEESANAVRSMPAGYSKWMNDNNQRILTAKSTPYFIKDNYIEGEVGKGLRFVTMDPAPVKAFVPKALSTYENELSITVDKTIFQHLELEIPLKSEGRQGAYFHPDEKYVNIPIDERRKQSKWKAESVVYHEYGHAIDWQNGLRGRREVKSLMDKYRKAYSEGNDKMFKQFDKALWDLGVKSATDGKFDRMNQVGALDDTIMALNSNYGRGHSKQYFKNKGFPEAEFLAHAFENKYIGNPVFRKLAPDLYRDMIKLIDQLLGIK